MSKTHALATPRVSPVAVAAGKAQPEAPKTKAAKKPVAAEVPAETTKTTRIVRVDRETCAAARKDADPRSAIKATDKPNNARPGTMRHAIIEAVRSAKDIVDACTKEVNGAEGTKHAEVPYRIRKVDVGFCIANGFITLGSTK